MAKREEKIREDWVRTMQARIVREELQKCHKSEGVNHYQVCHDLAQTYMDLLKDAKVSFLGRRKPIAALTFDRIAFQVQGFRIIDK